MSAVTEKSASTALIARRPGAHRRLIAAAVLLGATSTASAADVSLTVSALPAAGGKVSAGPYICTTSIGTVDGAASSKSGRLNIQGGFICVEPYYNTACVADIDQSGSVDSGDISILLLLYGPAIGPFKFADLDRDGYIDSADLSLILLSYGDDCSAQSLAGRSANRTEDDLSAGNLVEADLLPLAR
jgi:hypothetical protein